MSWEAIAFAKQSPQLDPSRTMVSTIDGILALSSSLDLNRTHQSNYRLSLAVGVCLTALA